jgi:multiple sugar transport system substrate-binding protein
MINRKKQFRIAIRKFGPFESAIKKAWNAFSQQKHLGLELYTESLDLNPLEESLFGKEGLKNGDWDVAFISTDWLAMAQEQGVLLDLASHIKANPPDDYPQGWMDSMLRLQQFNDVVLGLPYHDGPEVLIYRKDLFEDAEEQASYQAQFGTPLALPTTWEEFHQIARFFTRPKQNLYGTVFAAYPDGHNTVYDFFLQLWTHGGSLFDEEGKVQIATIEAERALTFYRAILNDKSVVHPNARDMDSVKSGFAFADGQIAMMINWFGFAAMCETISESTVKGKVMIGEIPHDPLGTTASLSAYWTLSIATGSPHQDLAYQFLRFCANADMDKMLTLEGGIGCRRSTWQDPEVNNVIPFYDRLEHLGTPQ